LPAPPPRRSCFSLAPLTEVTDRWVFYSSSSSIPIGYSLAG
jgi:hypothetical protein